MLDKLFLNIEPCVLSSLFFILPFLYSYKLKNYNLSYASFLVLISSLLYHSTKNNILKYIDIFMVNSFGLYFTYFSFFYYYKFKLVQFLITPIFSLFCLFIYKFNKDYYDIELLHSLIHLLSSIGICFLSFGFYKIK